MAEYDAAKRRAIMDLVPVYAHSRRAGWTPDSCLPYRMALPVYLLLRRVAIERGDDPVPLRDLRANSLDPYSLADPFLDGLPYLVQRGLLDHAADTYVLTPKGRDCLTMGEQAANDYATGRITLDRLELQRLAETLALVAKRQHQAPEPTVKMHQDRVPHLRRFDPRQSPPVLLEYAVYALQRARDDAFIAAWRDAGLSGPEVELLSRVWSGAARTVNQLTDQTRDRIDSASVARFFEELGRDGYVAVDGTSVTISVAGRQVRDAIERETDRV